jgi:hypothetical protein
MAGWDETNPGDSDFVSAFPQNERELRAFIKSVIGADHDDAIGATKGRHKQVTLEAKEDDPIPLAGYGIIYTKDVDGLVNAYYMDPEGNASLFAGGGFSSGPVRLPVYADTFPTDLTHGFLTSRTFDGEPELYWVDGEGRELRMSFKGAMNVSFPEDALEFFAAFAELQMEASQFRGAVVIMEIVDGVIECDLSMGLNYYVELTENATAFRFINAPELRIPNILVKIKNSGEFVIDVFEYQAEGGLIEVPETFVGGLDPAFNKTTDYGVALFPGPLLSIYPVVMRDYP